MKKILAFALTLCLFHCFFISISADESTETNPTGKTVFTTTVPDSHKIIVMSEHAEIFINGKSGSEFCVDRLSEPHILIRPSGNYMITKVLMNGEDVTDKFSGGYLFIGKIFEDKTLTIETEKAMFPETLVNFSIKGTMTMNDKPFEGATIELHRTLKTSMTDKDGKFTFINVESGKHSMTVLKDDRVMGYIEFEIQLGNETSFILLEDGSYLVTIPDDIESVEFDFNLTDDGKIEIKNILTSTKQLGGDSTQHKDIPQTGDTYDIHLWITLLFLSGMGFASTTIYRKNHPLK